MPWQALTALILTGTATVFVWFAPARLERWTSKHEGKPGTHPAARTTLQLAAIALALASIVAASLAPAPALYGPLALFLVPVWNRRREDHPNKTAWLEVIESGLKDGEHYLYFLGALATIIGIIRLPS